MSNSPFNRPFQTEIKATKIKYYLDADVQKGGTIRVYEDVLPYRLTSKEINQIAQQENLTISEVKYVIILCQFEGDNFNIQKQKVVRENNTIR